MYTSSTFFFLLKSVTSEAPVFSYVCSSIPMLRMATILPQLCTIKVVIWTDMSTALWTWQAVTASLISTVSPSQWVWLCSSTLNHISKQGQAPQWASQRAVWSTGQPFMCSCGSVPCSFGAALHPVMHEQPITLTPEHFACMHLLSAYYIVWMGFSMQLAKRYIADWGESERAPLCVVWLKSL